MRTHDVLLVEARPGVGRPERETLEAAGHRVHVCYPSDSSGFPCVAVQSGTCPVDVGIDAAVVVADGQEATPFTTGVGCALRAGVPVVTARRSTVGPFGPYLAAESDGDPLAAVDAGVETRRRLIERDMRNLAAAVLRGTDIDANDVSVAVSREDKALRVILDGPRLADPLERALCVRALDAIRGREGPATIIDISYRPG